MNPVFNALTIMGAASSKRSRDSSMLRPNAANSRRARPRPRPRRSRPLLSISSTALSDAQRVVPGQDDRCGAKIDVGAERGQIGHQLQVVGNERIVVEVVLGRPQAVEAEVGGEPGQPDFLLPHARVGAIIPAVAGKHHHHADIHGALLRSLCVANYRSELPAGWRAWPPLLR